MLRKWMFSGLITLGLTFSWSPTTLATERKCIDSFWILFGLLDSIPTENTYYSHYLKNFSVKNSKAPSLDFLSYWLKIAKSDNYFEDMRSKSKKLSRQHHSIEFLRLDAMARGYCDKSYASNDILKNQSVTLTDNTQEHAHAKKQTVKIEKDSNSEQGRVEYTIEIDNSWGPLPCDPDMTPEDLDVSLTYVIEWGPKTSEPRISSQLLQLEGQVADYELKKVLSGKAPSCNKPAVFKGDLTPFQEDGGGSASGGATNSPPDVLGSKSSSKTVM